MGLIMGRPVRRWLDKHEIINNNQEEENIHEEIKIKESITLRS
jgi:hypothetical protein